MRRWGLEAQRLDPDTAAAAATAAAADVCLDPMDVATYASDLGRWRWPSFLAAVPGAADAVYSRLCSRGLR